MNGTQQRIRVNLKNLIIVIGSQKQLGVIAGVSQTQISQGLSFGTVTEKIYEILKIVAINNGINIDVSMEGKQKPNKLEHFFEKLKQRKGMIRPNKTPCQIWYGHESDRAMRYAYNYI